MSKHLGVMRRSGVVVTGFGRLYSIAPAFRAACGADGTFELGHCLLRLEVAKG